jgi:hypothetical protein
MENRHNALTAVLVGVGILAAPAGAASQAVIIQGWTPTEARPPVRSASALTTG